MSFWPMGAPPAVELVFLAVIIAGVTRSAGLWDFPSVARLARRALERAEGAVSRPSARGEASEGGDGEVAKMKARNKKDLTERT